DRVQIARGLDALDRAGRTAGAGPYQLQAAIAACHARAVSWETTDWPAIVSHYEVLAEIAPSPVIDLNHAVAIGLAHCPDAGLAAFDPGLPRGYPLSPAGRAVFLRRRGGGGGGAPKPRRALAPAKNHRERTFLAARTAAGGAGEGGGRPP